MTTIDSFEIEKDDNGSQVTFKVNLVGAHPNRGGRLMTRRPNQKGAANLAVLILAAAGLYLGFRAWTAMQTVLEPPQISGGSLDRGTVGSVSESQARDAILTEVSTPARDPFASARRRVSRSVDRQPAAPPPPQLRMILYDQLSPEVQFAVGGELSGRLKPGQSFKGWTVISVSARSCVVSKDGETLTLTPRR